MNIVGHFTSNLKCHAASEFAENEIKRYLSGILKGAVDDYDSRIGAIIEQEVIDDVLACGCKSDKGDFSFTVGDVKLAIGRALCKHLGIEV